MEENHKCEKCGAPEAYWSLLKKYLCRKCFKVELAIYMASISLGLTLLGYLIF